MGRILFNLTIALIISGIIITALPAQPALAAEITVPADYVTIQEVIDSANNGDTITVKPGTYNEWLTIDKPLTLQGEDRDTTILEAGAISTKDGITVKNISGVTIQNLTIRKYRFEIYLENSHNNVITNNIMDDRAGLAVDYCGIRTSNADNNMINNNIFQNNEYGIYLHSGSEGNIIEFNTFSSNIIAAIRLNSSSNNIVNDNSITNNGYGINIEYHANENIIEKNYISNNSKHGIRLFRCSANEILNNTISDNSLHGILLSNADNNEIIGNDISRNGSATDTRWKGISITYESIDFPSERNIIAYNIISDHPQEAIKLFSNHVTETEIYNNTIEGNKYGIYIHDAKDSLVYNNNFINNATQAKDHWMNSSVFNLPKPDGGNYWSNWTGPDADGDDFVDKPYKFVFLWKTIYPGRIPMGG